MSKNATEQEMKSIHNNEESCLKVKDLQVKFHTLLGNVNAVNGVDFEVGSGEAVGIVGESGCGKSVTAQTILQLLPDNADLPSGRVEYRGEDGSFDNLLDFSPDGRKMRRIRGGEISMVFQEPMTAFSPVHTIGNQICESMFIHQDVTRKEARERATKLLRHVGISAPEQRIDEYTFQLSGGMRQRAMIASALACDPQVLIADEPTTALDVTTQAKVLRLMKQMQRDFDLSLILITHDLGVVAHMVDRVYVLYLGRVLEAGPVQDVFKDPQHPYTQDLLRSIPRLRGRQKRLQPIQGSVPDAYSLPSGCPYHPRCSHAMDICKEDFPKQTSINPRHLVKCYLHLDRGT